MDQAAKPILIATVGILAFSLVLLGVRAGDEDAAPTGDGASAAGQTDSDQPVAAPDVTSEPTTAPDPAPEPSSSEPDPAPDATSSEAPAPEGDGSAQDGGAPDGEDAAGGTQDDELDGLDDMPQTGGGALAVLGGLVAAGAAGGLARRR